MKKTQKNFNVNIADLHQLGHRLLSLMERDIAEFNKYGVTQEHIEVFRQQFDAFQKIEYDELYEQRQMLLSQQKNELTEELKIALRNLNLKVEMAYEQSNVIFLSINRTKLVKLNAADLCVHTKAIIALIEENLNILTNYGLNQNEINNLKRLEEELSEVNFKRELAIYKRVSVTNYRLSKSNEIYKQISQYFYMGRKMWGEQSEALYNDYLLYKKKSK